MRFYRQDPGFCCVEIWTFWAKVTKKNEFEMDFMDQVPTSPDFLKKCKTITWTPSEMS